MKCVSGLVVFSLCLVSLVGALFTEKDRTFGQCVNAQITVAQGTGIPATIINGTQVIMTEAPGPDDTFRQYTIPTRCFREGAGEPTECTSEFVDEVQSWANNTREVDPLTKCSCFIYFYERLNKPSTGDTDRRVTVRFFQNTTGITASTSRDDREDVARSIITNNQFFNVSGIYWVMNDCPEARCPFEFSFRRLRDSDRCGFATRDLLYDIDDDDEIASDVACNQVQLQMTSRAPILDNTYVFAVRGTPGQSFLLRYDVNGDEPSEGDDKNDDASYTPVVTPGDGTCTFSGQAFVQNMETREIFVNSTLLPPGTTTVPTVANPTAAAATDAPTDAATDAPTDAPTAPTA